MLSNDAAVAQVRARIAGMGIGPAAAPNSITTTELGQLIGAGSFEHGFSEVAKAPDGHPKTERGCEGSGPGFRLTGHTAWISMYVGLGVVMGWRVEQKTAGSSDPADVDIDFQDDSAPLGLINTRGEAVDLTDAEGELRPGQESVLDAADTSTWLELNFSTRVDWELEALKACRGKLQRAS